MTRLENTFTHQNAHPLPSFEYVRQGLAAGNGFLSKVRLSPLPLLLVFSASSPRSSHQSLYICPMGWMSFHRLFSPAVPCICCATSCKAPLPLLSPSHAGTAKDHEPHQQTQEKGFAQHTHRETQKIKGWWAAALPGSAAVGWEDLNVMSSSMSTAPPEKCHLWGHFQPRPPGRKNAEKKEGISLAAAVIRLPSSKYSKGMGLLKRVLPIFCSSLLCLQQRSALSYLLLRSQHILC